MSFLFALSAILATPLLEFDPPTLNLLDSNKESIFKCRLKTKPTKDVRVFFEAPGLTFGNCSYVIPADKHDQYIEIPVRGVPVFVDRPGDDIVIKAKVDTPDQPYDETAQEYKGHRTYTKGGVCTSIGDPHYTTFDGYAVTRQGSGAYHLFDHEHLSIQATQTECNPGTTCNGAVSVRYGSSVFILDVRDKQENKEIQAATPNNDGVVYTPPAIKGSGRVHRLKMPCGTVVELVNNWNDKIHYIDVTINLGYGYEGYGGVCNQIKPKDNKLHCKGNIFVNKGDDDKFLDSWKVLDEINHILGKYLPSKPEKKDCFNVCTLPPAPQPPAPVPPPPQVPAYTPVQTTEVAATVATTVSTIVSTTIVTSTTVLPTVTTTTVVSTSVEAGTTTVVTSTSVLPALSTSTQAITSTVATVSTVSSAQPQYTQPPANPEYTKEVTAHCQGLFAAPGCDKLIPSAPYVQACVSDALTTGNYLMSEAMKIAYLARCNTLTGYMQQDVQPAVVQNATQVRKDCGLGSNQCINSCSGKGLCGPNGCVCNPGFGGLDCSVDLNAKVSYNQDTKQYGTNNPVYQQMPAPTENKDALPAAAPSPAGYGQTAQSTLGPVLSSAEAKSVIGLLALAFIVL
ncbi:hypothetical protein EDD86DRAFT_116553 [Gorgonomyces haynaldii]|nr:hypothetical protein EDD86DRAFT_116553 [Gorgonomyces haynaldii]